MTPQDEPVQHDEAPPEGVELPPTEGVELEVTEDDPDDEHPQLEPHDPQPDPLPALDESHPTTVAAGYMMTAETQAAVADDVPTWDDVA